MASPPALKLAILLKILEAYGLCWTAYLESHSDIDVKDCLCLPITGSDVVSDVFVDVEVVLSVARFSRGRSLSIGRMASGDLSESDHERCL